MIDATPTTCRHGAEVKGLEVISLEAITTEDPRGLVDAEVPVAMRQAVYDRVFTLEQADPHGGYWAQQIHTDGCRTLATAEAMPSTPAEMFAHLRPAEAAACATDAPAEPTPSAPAAAAAPVGAGTPKGWQHRHTFDLDAEGDRCPRASCWWNEDRD